jgi:signal peptidase I
MEPHLSGEPAQSKPRRTLSGICFTFLAALLQKSNTGNKVVQHVMNRIGAYSQAWSFTLTIVLVVLLRCTVVTAFYIPSGSMLNTLKIDDRIFVFRLAYLFNEPKVGDIVVFRVPEDNPYYEADKPVWIKRVVGVGGDRVAISGKHLVVNGKVVSDPPIFKRNPYYSHLQGMEFKETVVPKGHVLLFGDNSWSSCDSRYWGPISEEQIIGKAFVRFWPFSRLGPLHGESVSPLPSGS